MTTAHRPAPSAAWVTTLFLGFLMLTLFSNCASYYTPTPLPTFFSKRNDFAANFSTSLQNIHMHLAYSPLKHLYVASAVQMNYKLNHTGWELALGSYFNPQEKVFIEVSGGVGRSSFSYEDISGSCCSFNTGQGNYQKLFAGFNFGPKIPKIHLGVGGRVNWVTQRYDADFDGNRYYQDYLAGKTFFPTVYEGYIYLDFRVDERLYIANILGANATPYRYEDVIRLTGRFYRFGLVYRLNEPQALKPKR